MSPYLSSLLLGRHSLLVSIGQLASRHSSSSCLQMCIS